MRDPIKNDVSKQRSTPPRAAWPGKLIELGALLRHGPALNESTGTRASLWLLLNSVLQQSIRMQRRRTGPISDEDVEDLAAEKSLDLMNMIDAKEWDIEHSAPEKVVAFITRVARNGLVDYLRKSSRRPVVNEENMDKFSDRSLAPGRVAELPTTSAERSSFVNALIDCVRGLKPPHQHIWFFRVLLDMPSKRIARHPDVAIKAGHVDVVLQRCRHRVRGCMEDKGFQPSDMPPGTFTALWRAFRIDDTN